MHGDEFAVVSYPIIVPAGTLTTAEAEIATLVARGMSNKAIAEARGSSVHTVANQLKSIFRKLGVQSRLDLLRLLTMEGDEP